LLATVIGRLWILADPSVPVAAFAVVGGAAFLAASMKMPLTAIALSIEFSRVSHNVIIPISFAVVGSTAVYCLCCLPAGSEIAGYEGLGLRALGDGNATNLIKTDTTFLESTVSAVCDEHD
jgi:hypothetical protein